MSVPVRNPMFQSYTPRSSGDVQTGELQHVRGGGRAACIYSGAIAPAVTGAPGALRSGGSVLFYSGAGRLNSVLLHTQITSGQPFTFYDAGITARSGVYTDGTISESGARILYVVPPAWNPAASGVVAAAWTGEPFRPDVPFQSGLCVMALSGAPGFTVTWTPEVSTSFPNA